MKTTNWQFIIEANWYAYKGEHWFDPEKKMRFMRYRGVVFKWNQYREHWERYEEEVV